MYKKAPRKSLGMMGIYTVRFNLGKAFFVAEVGTF